MPRFGFDDPAIHGVDKITAEGPYSQAALTLCFHGPDGKRTTLSVFATSIREKRYFADLARAFNQVAEDHGHLTDDEREEFLGEPLSRLTPVAQSRPPVEVVEGSAYPHRFRSIEGGVR